ncbi:MAG: hypothetical protein H7333_09420 [Bdellovibrionales bacterium]|nr:hypothetical protein [Oligoflexia bacterium]
MNFRCELILLFLFALSACSASAIKKSPSTDQVIQSFNLLSVRFSRPEYAVADPDDFSEKERSLHCESTHQLWKKWLEGTIAQNLIKCINEAGRIQVATAHYLFVPKTQPYLEVNKFNQEGPACLYRLLPRLPLPREIYFLGKASGRADLQAGQQCYAMSFNTKANQVLDTELRSPRFEVDFHFPLVRKLKSSQDLEIWLLVSTLSLFEEEQVFRASVVPDQMEAACFQNDPLFYDKKSGKIPPVFWP